MRRICARIVGSPSRTSLCTTEAHRLAELTTSAQRSPQHEHVLKHDLKEGEEVKLLCKDNDILQDWATPIKCLKVLMKGPGVHKEFADCGWY